VALIELRGVTKLYRMGDSVVRALDGVDLKIEAGEFVAITGPSGSGKSTLMHLIGCLDRPTSGSVLLGGRDVSNLSDRQLAHIRNRQIGFVFQTFNLINRMTAVDNVAVPLFYARQANTRGPALRALERIGLPHRAHHKANALSGGERQRVAIARAIVNNPLLLLADEPTGNLDSHSGQQIMEIFQALNAQGVTIVLVTHEPDIAAHARRIVQMRDGKIVSDVPASSFTAPPSAKPPQSAPPPQADRMPIAVDRPATPAAQVAASVGADPTPSRPRLIRGANAALACGLIGPALYILASIPVALVSARANLKLMDPMRPPKELLLASLVAVLGLIVGLVMGILAIYLAILVRRRLREEPGQWRGRHRAWIALALGCLTVVGPIATMALRLAGWRG
jgi:putative ABC transport system ATP-binding protein